MIERALIGVLHAPFVLYQLDQGPKEKSSPTIHNGTHMYRCCSRDAPCIAQLSRERIFGQTLSAFGERRPLTQLRENGDTLAFGVASHRAGLIQSHNRGPGKGLTQSRGSSSQNVSMSRAMLCNMPCIDRTICYESSSTRWQMQFSLNPPATTWRCTCACHANGARRSHAEGWRSGVDEHRLRHADLRQAGTRELAYDARRAGGAKAGFLGWLCLAQARPRRPTLTPVQAGFESYAPSPMPDLGSQTSGAAASNCALPHLDEPHRHPLQEDVADPSCT